MTAFYILVVAYLNSADMEAHKAFAVSDFGHYRTFETCEDEAWRLRETLRHQPNPYYRVSCLGGERE